MSDLGGDIPCAAGVRGDGPCSFELCPPGIGCRRVREQRRQGEGEAVLGEGAVTERMVDEARWEADAHAVPDETIRRLVTAGYNRGRTEERERIARRFDSADGDGLGSLAPVVTGLFEQVARIVRGTS